jgi:hypothetical protein
MKRLGLWFLCGAWALFAATELWLATTDKADYVPWTGGMALFFTALFIGLGVFAGRGRLPLDVTSLAHPEYWLTSEHRRELDALYADLMYMYGAGTVFFVALLDISLFDDSAWSGYGVTVALVAAIVVPTVRFIRGLARIPRAGQPGSDGDPGGG